MKLAGSARSVFACLIFAVAPGSTPLPAAEKPATVTSATSAGLVKKEAPPKPPSYAKPGVAAPIARSQGAVREREWTLLYYLDADCNLEAPMLDDVDELELIGSTDDVNVLALVDRTPGYDDREGNWSNSRLLYVTRDTQQGRLGSKVLGDLQEMDTADPRTLVEFVAFGIQNFPARHYALFLGNHGGTWMGMINDETDNEAGMKLTDLVGALGALKTAGAPKLDVITFDMCLMSQIEVMDAISPFASYGVASEELEPGQGYPNHRVLHALTRNPKMAPAEFARTLVKEWNAAYTEVGEATVTSAATDLSKIGGLVAAVDAFAEALAQAPEPVKAAAARARAGTHFYGGEESGGDLASYDIGEFAARLAADPDAAPLQTQLAAIRAAVQAAVIEHAEGEAHRGSTGLAIYFPANGKVDPGYKSIPFSRGKWDELLTAALGLVNGLAKLEIQSPNPTAMQDLGGGFDVKATVSGVPASVHATIGIRDKEGGITTLSEEEVPSPGAAVGADGSVASRWKDGQSFTYRVSPKVRAISDGKSSRLVPMTPIAPGSRYARADASYNSLLGDMQVSTIFDRKSGKLDTIFCQSDKGARTPTAVHPVKGERLVFYQPVRPAGKDPAAKQRFRPVPPLVIPGKTTGSGDGGIRLIDTGLPKGDYVLALTAFDAKGNPTSTADVNFRAGGAGGPVVAPGVTYPVFLFPAVGKDEIQYVDLTLIIPAAEYGHFEATWTDYDFLAVTERDDYSAQDLAYLDAVALDAADLAFDVDQWSDEFDDDALPPGSDGDADDDGAPDESDSDDDNDGLADDQDLDDDGISDADEDGDADDDGVLDESDTDDDGDGELDDQDLDDDNDGVSDADEDGDADDDGVLDEEDADDDGDGVGDEQDADDDNDGVSDADEDGDADDDGTLDEEDADDDGDGVGDEQDLDDDNDGEPDAEEEDDGGEEDEGGDEDDGGDDDGGDDDAGGDDDGEEGK